MIGYNVVFRHQLLPDYHREVTALQTKYASNPCSQSEQFDYYPTVDISVTPGLPGNNWPYVQDDQVVAYSLNNGTTLMSMECLDYSAQDAMALQKCPTPFYLPNPVGYPPIATPNSGLIIGLAPPAPELNFGQPTCFDYASLKQPVVDLMPYAPLMSKCKAAPLIPYFPLKFVSPSVCFRGGEQTCTIPASAWPTYDQTGQYIQFNPKPQMPIPYTPYCFKSKQHCQHTA